MNRVGRVGICVLSTAFLAGCAKSSGEAAHESQRLAAPTTIQGVYEFDPPPDGADPSITADEAAASLEQADGIEDDAPILVVFTNIQQLDPQGSLLFDHVLAWDIKRSGCFPIPQVSPLPGASDSSTSSCYTHEDYLVDANTGSTVQVIQTP